MRVSHIYGGGCYGAADRCTSDLQQRGKPMGADLSDKTAGSIISVLLVSVSESPQAERGSIRNGNNPVLHREGNRITGADKKLLRFIIAKQVGFLHELGILFISVRRMMAKLISLLFAKMKRSIFRLPRGFIPKRLRNVNMNGFWKSEIIIRSMFYGQMSSPGKTMKVLRPCTLQIFS